MIVGLIQARVSSTRLPGKVLEPVLGQPMLSRQIERLRRSRRIGKLMVATSLSPDDDALESLCRDLGIPCRRGPLDDVLERFRSAADGSGADWIVRLTGDCPLADWEVIDQVISFGIEGGYDYASNTLQPSWPDGLDVELMRASSLETAAREAQLPSQREHVTSFLYTHPDRFRLGNLSHQPDLSALRWTVDEPEDLAFVRRVYEELYRADPAFTTADILALLAAHPEIVGLNQGRLRNEGYLKSLAADPAVPKNTGAS